MATKDKDKKGPSTQRTGTQGVSAVGVNHGMTRQESVKPTPEQAVAQLSQPVMPQQQPQVNYSPGFTDVPGSPSYQQYGAQQQSMPANAAVQAPVQRQPAAQASAAPASVPQSAHVVPASVQPVQQQQFAMPQQITLPNGQVVNLQQSQQAQPQSVTIKGIGTVQAPNTQPSATKNSSDQQPAEKSAAQQNEEYERTQMYNQAVDEYRKAGGNPNAIRQHNDPNIERLQPTAEQAKKADDYAKSKAANGEDDEYVKTLKELLESKYESPEDREKREKREARQRRFAAIAEGLANVFNVGGAIAGAQPAQWKSGVGELYANQEAEADKRRTEYREALKDLVTYRTAVRNGDIATMRAIEEKRKNDFYERKMLEDIASKQANDELKKQKQEAEDRRKEQAAADKHQIDQNKIREQEQKLGGNYSPSKNTKKSTKKGSGGSKKKSGYTRNPQDRNRSKRENDGRF